MGEIQDKSRADGAQAFLAWVRSILKAGSFIGD
jgi:hypothetical protein